MDKLKLHTPDLAEANFRKLAAMFPNAVTETITGYTTDENGKEKPIIERAIDADVLRQEISAVVVEGPQERYQFTWPDKKKSVVLANAPIAKTLRLDRSKSVGRDGARGSIDTENIYIEGDNLDALKLLQETYLGKVKMIYIDPPYNTGNDFIYNDDFSMAAEAYASTSGQLDEKGNRLVPNPETNGRFHTDWLNMLYPRLRIAKDLLTDDGIIFISLDDNEIGNLRKICDEIFGKDNFIAQLIWHSRQNKDNRNISGVSVDHEYILCYSKQFGQRIFRGTERKTDQYTNPDNDWRGPWTSANMVGLATADARPNLHYDLINPADGVNYGCPAKGWRYDRSTMKRLIEEDRILWPDCPDGRPRRKSFLNELSDNLPGFSSIIEGSIYTNTATKEVTSLFNGKHCFDFPKPVALLEQFISQTVKSADIVLDFYSGSATTAHAIMELNATDDGKRKFILVQLPESCGEKSETRKAGYSTICDIGEERIRRAGDKIRSETGADIDYGFRVFRVDSTNMEDVYYTPAETKQDQLDFLAENIKPDRTPEDLLFQVMLDLGILLSSSIEETVIAGKNVFSVADGYLLACFDKNVTEETVTEIAKRHPFYAVFRDSSMATDSVAANFEQIFETYSPKTVRKVL